MKISQDELRSFSVGELRELVRRQVRHGDIHVEGTAPGRRGYVTQGLADGSVRQVPYTQARTAYYKPGSIVLSKEEQEASFVAGTVPIKREVHRIPKQVWGDKSYRVRSGQERVESLTRRYVTQWRNGGMTDAVLREIEGEYWKLGMPVTHDRLRQIAQRGLERAERRKLVDASTKTTRRVWETK